MKTTFSKLTKEIVFLLVAGTAIWGVWYVSQPQTEVQATQPAPTVVGAAADLPVVKVFKSATCGCCNDWIAHLQTAGFSVESVNTNDMQGVKRDHGVPPSMTSCHTALVGPYVVEGHVPAEDIKRLLSEQREVAGLAVPGMPIGSPGMEQGHRHDAYRVYTFTAQGDTTVFARHHE